ncbi:DUF262 domain-containing protein [Paenalcaligenes faecalis]|uniref:DUF262 domain-containing protein n=1 Tax=Paenalcaligenes faecalis TaxID=2980099 RepID=UPI0022B9737C|nr:DUF262 domain-containing protein [Paenalcaligenes faecalis]
MQLLDKHKLCLKNIYELLGENFYIPAYQRGYRWGEIQVKELLDDIWDFSRASNDDGASFYCLQPIVVVQDPKGWQVVDGQQRLTTLFLILHYIEKEHLRRSLQDAYKKSIYSLSYETRMQSARSLDQIHKASGTTDIDFFHMKKAYEAIKEWFSDKDYNDHNTLLNVLLAKPDAGNSVRVIWYDLSDECTDSDYAIDVFSRINIGKIPLTNAELVRALFLRNYHPQSNQVDLKQLQIATEWDGIENRLQDDSFWYFIHNSNKNYATRIEYIFDLMKGKADDDEAFFTFHQFHEDFKKGSVDVEQLWGEVKRYFLTFEEWYQNRELYHLIGFLISCNEKVSALKALSEQEGSTKTKFKDSLKQKIKKELEKCHLDSIEYGDGNINKLLLMFNIQTLLSTKDADMRFPFDRYKQEKWDIEHIRSQTDDAINKESDRKLWLENLFDYFNGSKIKEEKAYIALISELLDKKFSNEEFTALYEKIIQHFQQENVPWGSSIGNLTLLDSSTNRSYKNALFPVKRARIIENDKKGVFMPICTKNVFLKYYSQKATDLLYWTEDDALGYQQAIASTLKDYLPKKGVNND